MTEKEISLISEAAESLVKAFRLKLEGDKVGYFSGVETPVSRLIKKSKFRGKQKKNVKKIIEQVLETAYYGFLLFLDGAANFGGLQQFFKFYGQDGNLISDGNYGQLEAYAWEYFFGSKKEWRVESKGENKENMNILTVPQTAAALKLNPTHNAVESVVIRVPEKGHSSPIQDATILSRDANNFTSLRQIIARDILELKRVFPHIPNSALQELIRLNKSIFGL